MKNRPINVRNYENTPGIMKNRPGIIKIQPKNVKDHKNQPVTMKNQSGTVKNHKNQPGTLNLYIIGRFCLSVCNAFAYSCPAPLPHPKLFFRLVFHGSRSVFMVFHGSRLVFHGFSWFQVGFSLFFMVFHGSRLVFNGFSCFFMVLGWFFMVFLQNVPAQTVSWPNDPF